MFRGVEGANRGDWEKSPRSSVLQRGIGKPQGSVGGFEGAQPGRLHCP